VLVLKGYLQDQTRNPRACCTMFFSSEIVWMYIMFLEFKYEEDEINAWFDIIKQVFSDLKANLTLKMKVKKFKRNEIALR